MNLLHHKTFSFAFTIMAFCLIRVPSSDPTWNLVKKKNNIEVYSRMSDDDILKEIKIIGRVRSTLSELVLALEDVEAQKEWVLRTIDARTLEYLSESNFVYYISTDMPFPIKDRDLIVEYVRTQDERTKVVQTSSRALPSFLPEIDGFIRIPIFDSIYTLTPREDGWVTIEYIMKIDPGGALPPWLVNIAVTRGPVSTIESLYRLIYSGRYQGQLAFGISEP